MGPPKPVKMNSKYIHSTLFCNHIQNNMLNIGFLSPYTDVKKQPREQKFKDDVEGEIKTKDGKKKDSEDITNKQYEKSI